MDALERSGRTFKFSLAVAAEEVQGELERFARLLKDAA